jgi:hypothetical protein
MRAARAARRGRGVAGGFRGRSEDRGVGLRARHEPGCGPRPFRPAASVSRQSPPLRGEVSVEGTRLGGRAGRLARGEVGVSPAPGRRPVVPFEGCGEGEFRSVAQRGNRITAMFRSTSLNTLTPSFLIKVREKYRSGSTDQVKHLGVSPVVRAIGFPYSGDPHLRPGYRPRWPDPFARSPERATVIRTRHRDGYVG